MKENNFIDFSLYTYYLILLSFISNIYFNLVNYLKESNIPMNKYQTGNLVNNKKEIEFLPITTETDNSQSFFFNPNTDFRNQEERQKILQLQSVKLKLKTILYQILIT